MWDQIKEVAVLLKDASPWAALGVTIIAVTFMIIGYLKQRNKESELEEVKKIGEENKTAIVTLTSKFEDTKTVVDRACDILSTHDKNSASRADEHNDISERQLDLLEKVVRELVNLNASQPGKVISIENSKLMITYQWNWCRDESSRLLRESVMRNGFKNNEEVVARKVFRAWKAAAKSAMESLEKLQGLNYPYEELFTSHVLVAWQKSWQYGSAFYHRIRNINDVTDSADFDGQISEYFESVLYEYFDTLESVDDGRLYICQDQVDTDDQELLESMTRNLKTYHGTKSNAGIDIRKEVRKRASTNVVSKPKKSVNDCDSNSCRTAEDSDAGSGPFDTIK